MKGLEIREIAYGSRPLRYSLAFSNRKSLAISVHPDGSVSATAPEGRSAAEVDKHVHAKAQWITAKQLEYARYQLEWTSPRLYVQGSLHPYLGRRHRLRLSSGREWSLALRNGAFEVHGPALNDAARMHREFQAWYSKRARVVFEEQLERALSRFPARTAVTPSAVMVRRMERRWGSMSASGRLQLNPRLVEHAKPQIEYVITHELAHRIVPDHSAKFWKMLGRAMPDWRERKLRLECGK